MESKTGLDLGGSRYIPPIFDDETLVTPIYDAAKNVSPYALFEFATHPYPPKSGQVIVEALCFLLGLPGDWNSLKELIAEEKLTPMIEEFHPESVPEIILEQVSQISKLPEMQVEVLGKQEAAVSQLGDWIHAIAIYYDVKYRPEIFEFVTESDQIQDDPIPEKTTEPIKKDEPAKPEEPKKKPPRIVTIKEALESIQNLSKQDIIEVRSYKKPPAVVLLVLEALCILFDSMKIERKSYTQIVCEPNYKKLLQDTDQFIRRVLTLDYDKIPKEKLKKLKEYISKPEFEIDKVRKASIAAASFSLLIISIVQKSEQLTSS